MGEDESGNWFSGEPLQSALSSGSVFMQSAINHPMAERRELGVGGLKCRILVKGGRLSVEGQLAHLTLRDRSCL